MCVLTEVFTCTYFCEYVVLILMFPKATDEGEADFVLPLHGSSRILSNLASARLSYTSKNN